MAGQVETNSGPVEHAGNGAGEQQAAAPTTHNVVSDEPGSTHESGRTGHSEEQTRSVDARVSQLEKQMRQMRKLFTNHSHSQEDETPPASASAPEVVNSQPEAGAVTPAIAENPPVETASHLEEKQRARSGYFRRAHRIRSKVRAGQ